MKIMAHIEVEKIVSPSGGTYTFRCEKMEVEVIRVLRQRCGSGAAAKRFFYMAIIKRPERMHPDAQHYPSLGISDVRVNIIRSHNKDWKPPIFAADSNIYEVPA